jgi:hypothetical protein
LTIIVIGERMREPPVNRPESFSYRCRDQDAVAVEVVRFLNFVTNSEEFEALRMRVNSSAGSVCCASGHWIHGSPDNDGVRPTFRQFHETVDRAGNQVRIVVKPKQVFVRSSNGMSLRKTHTSGPIQLSVTADNAHFGKLILNGLRRPIGRSVID